MKFLKFPWTLILRICYAIIVTCKDLFEKENSNPKN